jgi:hypothetical protein
MPEDYIHKATTIGTLNLNGLKGVMSQKIDFFMDYPDYSFPQSLRGD